MSDLKKEIEAFIEATVLSAPQMKDKLTVPVVWNYLQLPDSSFGWAGKEAMPQKLKLLVIAAHINLGAPIGYGHVYFLGNKLYQSADFVRSKAAHDPDWKMVGRSTYRPHTPEEKTMFGLKDGDMSCRLEIDIEYKGQRFVAEGDGIIGYEELQYKSQYGKPKAGLDSAKNRAMSLKTRAMRDLYARCYPVHDLPVAPDVSEEFAIDATASLPKQMELASTYSTEADRKEIQQKVQTEAAAEIIDEQRTELLERVEAIKKDAKEKGLKTKQLSDACGAKTFKEITEYDNDRLLDAVEAMVDYIDNLDDIAEKPFVTKQLEQSPMVKAALKKYDRLIAEIQAAGMLPTKVLGFNHLNVFEYHDVKLINDNIAILENALKPADEVDVDEIFGATESASDDAALAKIDELLENPKVDKSLKDALKELRSKTLIAGDDELILKNARMAVMKKDISYIMDMVKARS